MPDELSSHDGAASRRTHHQAAAGHSSPLVKLMMRLCRPAAGSKAPSGLMSPGSCFRSIVLGCLVLGYLGLGALLFWHLERPAELQRERQATALLRAFAGQFSCSAQPENLTLLLGQLLAALPSGATVSAGTNGSNVSLYLPTRWDLQSAVFFSMTVITTIGYGNVAPSTGLGRFFCCLYALFGIPLLATFLGCMAAGLKRLEDRVMRLRCWRNRPRLARLCGFAVYLGVGFLLYFVLPSVGFVHTESWPFGMAMYYCFVTLSTIGFGDLIAGQSQVAFPGYKVLLSMWIYTGLIYVSGIIAAIQTVMEGGSDSVSDAAAADQTEVADLKPPPQEPGGRDCVGSTRSLALQDADSSSVSVRRVNGGAGGDRKPASTSVHQRSSTFGSLPAVD